MAISGFAIREETPHDVAGIRDVHEAAFARADESRLVDRLRSDGLIVASLIAAENERVVANVVFSRLPIRTPAASVEAVALAPVAVLPEYQRRGIGAALIREGLNCCKARGIAAALVLGDPAYYTRFGFSTKLAERIQSPYSGAAWMALELTKGALPIEGSVTYPDAFAGA